MNQQLLPQTRAIKRRGLLINLSLIAYVCLIIGFLIGFLLSDVLYGFGSASVATTTTTASNGNAVTYQGDTQLFVPSDGDSYIRVYPNSGVEYGDPYVSVGSPNYPLIQGEQMIIPSPSVSYSPALSYFNTAISIITGIIPCLLLLLYVWKLHGKAFGKYFIPVVFGLVALGYVSNTVVTVASFFQYKQFSTVNLIDLVLPVTMAVCCGVMAFLCRTGRIHKVWLIIAAIASILMCAESCLAFPYALHGAPILPKTMYGANILGDALFYTALLLFAFFNMVPGKNVSEDPEPTDDTKNVPFFLGRN